ncbi:MAG TPA: hypothetical protein VEN47_05665 [Myxococcota bacterium]|nr:hypothetical protein [Myxococcota bacterium]
MATVLADVEWEACPLAPHRDRALEAELRREMGTVPSGLVYFTPVPWVVRSTTALAPFSAPMLHCDGGIGELIGVVVSQDNSCRYCFGMTRMLLRVHGFSEARIRELEHDFLEAGIDPRAKAALDFARRISRASPLVGASDLAEVRAAGWSVAAVRELACVSAYSVYMNRLMTVGAVPYEPMERLASAWVIPWIAPFLRLQMRRRQKHAVERARASGEVRADGPWSFLVRALAGSTFAKPLRETLDAAFASPVLSRRAKALVFAVVARGLDCALSAREAHGLLLETGLAAEQINEMLTHLDSPELEPIEAALLPFARGTIRGRPTQLQQRTRALAQTFGDQRTVEAIGLAALANAVCRLGALTALA